MAARRIYLDWNATAPLLDEARAAAMSVMQRVGNASSVHAEGRAQRLMIENARRSVAALVGAASANVVFTSGATEAANLVLTPNYRMGRAGLTVSHLYVSAIEHPAVREGGRFARDQVSEIPVTSEGLVDLAALNTLLGNHDKAAGLPMVAVMLANNETGIIQPIRAVADLVKTHGGLLVVDAVQAAGRMDVSMDDLGADFLLLSAHKLGGLGGAGAVVSRGETLMPLPLIRGGGQEKGHRSGTENATSIAAFGAAAAFHAVGRSERLAEVERLRDRLEAGLRAAAPDTIIHGLNQPRLPNTSFFTLPGLKAETGQIAFDLDGIAVSAGSACSSGKVGDSHVLSAMGFDAKIGGLRLSLGQDTTDTDIDQAIAVFAKIAGRRKSVGAAA